MIYERPFNVLPRTLICLDFPLAHTYVPKLCARAPQNSTHHALGTCYCGISLIRSPY